MTNYQNRDKEARAQLSIKEAKDQIQNTYHAGYASDPGFDAYDQLLACETLTEGTSIKDTPPGEQKDNHEETDEAKMFQVKVRGKGLGYMVTAPQKYDYDEILSIFTTKRKTTKEDLALFLAKTLNDLNSLNYYESLVSKHRTDFLRNSLIITLTAFQNGWITKTKASYFTGVIKGKILLAERLKKYKQKHTT